MVPSVPTIKIKQTKRETRQGTAVRSHTQCNVYASGHIHIDGHSSCFSNKFNSFTYYSRSQQLYIEFGALYFQLISIYRDLFYFRLPVQCTMLHRAMHINHIESCVAGNFEDANKPPATNFQYTQKEPITSTQGATQDSNARIISNKIAWSGSKTNKTNIFCVKCSKVCYLLPFLLLPHTISLTYTLCASIYLYSLAAMELPLLHKQFDHLLRFYVYPISNLNSV